MTKLMILILIIAFVFTAQAGSKQITPEEFQHWKVVKITPAPQPGFYWMFFKNPDHSSEIKTVAALVSAESYLYGYRYFEGIDIYEFKLDPKTGRYIGGLISDEEREACVKCHLSKSGLKI